MKNIRTDVHRPSVINPTEYEFVAFEYVPVDDIGAAMFLQAQREIIREHQSKTRGNYASVNTTGNCMVCGSVNAIYTVLFYHAPTNSYVRMGNDCAQKCDIAFSNGDFDAFKKRVGDARDAVAGKRKAEAHLTDRGYAQAWSLYTIWTTPCQCGLRDSHGDDNGTFCICPSSKFQYEERTIVDMIGKFVQYGNLTDKQFDFIGSLLNKINHREEIARQRSAEKEAAAPCPSGRLVIEGVIVSVKETDTPYGWVTKILVKHDSGFTVYGSRPSASNAGRGERVKFTATVKISDTDPKFGFFSRPTGMSVISTTEVA